MPSMTPMMSAILRELVIDRAHGVDDLADDRAALDRDVGGGHGQLVGLARVVGVLLDGGGQLFHRAGGFFQGAGLLFGARRQVQVAGGNLAGGGGNGVGAVRTWPTILTRLSFMSFIACISWPVSSFVLTSMWLVRSPAATVCASFTA